MLDSFFCAGQSFQQCFFVIVGFGCIVPGSSLPVTLKVEFAF